MINVFVVSDILCDILYSSLQCVVFQASEQMKVQTSRSSSIIIALTDGKLEVYPYDMTVREVRRHMFKRTHTCDLSHICAHCSHTHTHTHTHKHTHT